METLEVKGTDNPMIVAPQLDLKYITSGEEFNIMAGAFDIMKTHKTDKAAIHEASRLLANSLKVCFKIDATIAVIDDVDSTGFYGFNIFPSISCMNKVIDELNHNHFKDIRAAWQQNTKWHIDIDGKLLYDISNHINAKECATLLLYSIEQIIFDYDTPIRIAYTIAKYRSKMNVMSRYMSDAPRLRDIYIIPFMVGCSFTNYVYADEARREQLLANSMIASNRESYERYSSAVQKILFTYGKKDIIDQSVFEIERRIVYILNWIYEGLNDLRHSALRVKENLRRHMVACRSPFIRLVFKNAILTLSKTSQTEQMPQAKKLINEGFEGANPEMKALVEKMIVDDWKSFVATTESHAADGYMDKYGYVKKVTYEDIDMIRVEAESIESVDDKIYLLERLYKHIGAINTARDMLKSNNSKKVKQTKNELDNLADYAETIRQYIIKYKIPPKGYGLYIKYPGGYEG